MRDRSSFREAAEAPQIRSQKNLSIRPTLMKTDATHMLGLVYEFLFGLYNIFRKPNDHHSEGFPSGLAEAPIPD